MRSSSRDESVGANRVRHTLSRGQRIVQSERFTKAYEEGERCPGRFMTLWVRKGSDSQQLGVVASKKVGKAHIRTRAKRLLREAYRLNRPRFEGKFDIVLSARAAIRTVGLQEVEVELINLANKAGILRNNT